jgi:hypothetical protein
MLACQASGLVAASPHAVHTPQTDRTASPLARAFVKDMRAFLVEKNGIKREEIAARQLRALRQHYTDKLRLFDVKEMFLRMPDNLD